MGGNGQAESGGRVARGKSGQDPYKWSAIWVSLAFTLTMPATLAIIIAVQPAAPRGAWSGVATDLGVEPRVIAMGEAVYQSTCAVCHGEDGRGLSNLGKPVRNSAFVQESTDEELFELIVKGRAPDDPANTSGVLMPARGAKELGDEQIRSVIAYLRAIQDPEAPTASVDAWVLDEEARRSAASVELTEHPGYDLFVASCSACHGKGGEGIENVGLPLTTSGFVRGKTDEELIAFIKQGRPIWDANNVTGLDMPPKGGNPAITDEELGLIVEYIRAVQERATGN